VILLSENLRQGKPLKLKPNEESVEICLICASHIVLFFDKKIKERKKPSLQKKEAFLSWIIQASQMIELNLS